ncbi:MAG: hypothetical protein NTV03_00705 [Candidatus Nomurabacteria bacterium]|nr:hypothetical protein [Candidatus Nomurabacteria bacterium]
MSGSIEDSKSGIFWELFEKLSVPKLSVFVFVSAAWVFAPVIKSKKPAFACEGMPTIREARRINE